MTKDQQADVTSGLKALASDAPKKELYAQATATWNAWDGPAARIEAGAKLSPHWEVFGAGTMDSRGPGAEVGARWSMDW